MASSKQLEPPGEFPFPFQPYGIQKDFMKQLYFTLERGAIGIFESPTGTGKSLSLICGALRWLVDSEERDKARIEAVLAGELPPSVLEPEPEPGATASALNGSTSGEEKGDTPATESTEATTQELDWFAAYEKERSEKEALRKLKEEMNKKARREARIKKLKEEHGTTRWSIKRKREGSPTDMEVEKMLAEARSGSSRVGRASVDDDIVVQEYFSDEECKAQENSDSEDDLEEEHVRKIYYCSRTHTQLAQFVREVQKSPYGGTIRVVTLGSRQNLCINEEVRRLRSITLINDRCLEMQKNKKKEPERDSEGRTKAKKRKINKSASCPFYKQGPMENFRDLALAQVQDIEQLVSVGRELGACPYYGVRYAIPSAQLVVLPYNTLLHGPTREAVGVKLKGNVVIIDEAHNLLDTIASVYSVEVTGAHVSKSHSQLSQYMERYKSRLKAKNLMYINQLLHILNSFIKLMEVKKPSTSGKEVGGAEETRLLKLNDFLFTSHMDNINFFKVLRYCQRSQISKKLNGFVDRYFETAITPSDTAVQSTAVEKKPVPSHAGATHQMNSPLMLIETFLQALTNADKDGRIIITRKALLSGSSLKFLLLNPSLHFTSIVSEARAVVVAGGTMQPVSEFKDQLLTSAGVRSERIMEFSCGHVIPPSHLLPLCLCKGPAGESFEFTFQNRDRSSMIDELGRALLNLCTVVPGGVVCFFPSYDYEKRVYSRWTETNLLDKIGKKKKVFCEPKLASQVDAVLSQYARCMEFKRGGSIAGGVSGALMLCVVGGKLSEGINFSDDLGRCIVMVGLPYPNLKSPELKEKMDYLNANVPASPDGRLAGQVHYENLCMKAVNQSIGRSIRHAKDYASIVLVDQRYARSSVREKLPDWIASQLQVCQGFGQAFAAIRKFFIEKR